jgi:methylenetetrahydrofolate reductase (NADPH)
MLAAATRVKGKVDAFLVPEMCNAVMKMSSLGACGLLQVKGFEAVMQVCCRDRNRLALQADLLAAHPLGISNVVAVTGEDPCCGDHHRARAVNDIDLFELLDTMQKLQTGRDMAGIELRGAPRYCIGSTINASASGGLLDLELEGLQKKMTLGTEFFITPPVFDVESFSRFMKRVPSQTRVVPTVLLLKSVGMARYINRHLPHVNIPEEIVERIQKAPDRVRACTRIATELISSLKDTGCSGVLISTLGWEDKLPSILEV